jgi:hypothetical protein
VRSFSKSSLTSLVAILMNDLIKLRRRNVRKDKAGQKKIPRQRQGILKTGLLNFLANSVGFEDVTLALEVFSELVSNLNTLLAFVVAVEDTSGFNVASHFL